MTMMTDAMLVASLSFDQQRVISRDRKYDGFHPIMQICPYNRDAALWEGSRRSQNAMLKTDYGGEETRT